MVVIFLGSKSDLDVGKSIGDHLKDLGIVYKLHIASAHKTPEYLLKLLKHYEGLKKDLVYICVAGRSNALGGFVDAQVVHPVINCPPQSEKYAGQDLLSSLRMPSGVAALTVLESDQAALAAAKILGMNKAVSLLQGKNRKKILTDDSILNKK